jgi:hypothetical protein
MEPERKKGAGYQLHILERTSILYYRAMKHYTFMQLKVQFDRLCGLVVRVPGYRSGGAGSISGTTRKKVVGLERGPIGFVSTTEELLDRNVAAPV